MLQDCITEGNNVLDQLAFLSCKGSFFIDNETEKEANDFVSELDAATVKVRDSWTFTVFSETSEVALERYFSYQVSYLSDLLAGLCPRHTLLRYEQAICGLIDFAGNYFEKYLISSTAVGEVYKKHFTAGSSAEANLISATLENIGLDLPIKNCLVRYLEEMTGDQYFPCTIGQLHYFRMFIRELLPVTELKDSSQARDFVQECLIQLEFNHFGVFVFFQEKIRYILKGKTKSRRLQILRDQAGFYAFKSRGELHRYDERWPLLTTMIAEWLRQEQEGLQQDPVPQRLRLPDTAWKLQLQLSVAHLAFLIRLFSKENVFGLVPLTNIFDFFAANFRTKRQETLSVGGLSKEYYTKNMVTAVEVRALLSKMITRINRDYFPVLAVICAVTFCP